LAWEKAATPRRVTGCQADGSRSGGGGSVGFGLDTVPVAARDGPCGTATAAWPGGVGPRRREAVWGMRAAPVDAAARQGRYWVDVDGGAAGWLPGGGGTATRLIG
jgi:hypothetical protein